MLHSVCSCTVEAENAINYNYLKMDKENAIIKDSHFMFKSMEFLEQFAASVTDFSSKYNNSTSILYAPDNLSGKPEKYPYYGDFPDTYMLRSYGNWWNKSEAAQSDYAPNDVDDPVSEDYITVGFETAVIPANVYIYETYNPGAVVRLWGRYTFQGYRGPWYLLFESSPKECPKTSRRFGPKIRLINDKVNEIRIELNQSLLTYHTSLDAVLLVGYKERSELQFEIFKRGFLISPDSSKIGGISEQEIFVHRDHDKIDIFSLLPHEIMVKIFQYLDMRSVFRSAQVCKRWYHVAKDFNIYKNINFRKYWPLMNDDILNLFRLRCKLLRKLDLSWCGGDYKISEDTFQLFLKSCGQQLTHLSLSNCDFVQNVALSEISKCSELVDLRLRNCFANGWTYNFLRNLKKLVAIDLYCTKVTDEALRSILQSNRNLKHLILDFCENLEFLDNIMEVISAYNTQLVTISCWKTLSLSAEGVLFLSKCSRLREIDLGWCFILRDPGNCLEHIASNCNDLRRLIISNWRDLKDHHLLPIIRSCKQLTQLDLLGIKNISGDICEIALVSLPKLELLDVSFCDGVKEEQVDSWRNLFPNVSVQRSCSSYNGSY